MADKKKVLYVDDEVANLNVFRIAFRRKYDITVVEDAVSGLELLKQGDYDVVISDHRMPGMSGIEMLETVGKDYPKIVRIIISEYVNDVVIRDAIKSFGLDGRVGKPWDLDELTKLIEIEK